MLRWGAIFCGEGRRQRRRRWLCLNLYTGRRKLGVKFRGYGCQIPYSPHCGIC
ncbi:hypothetical protein EJ110_NYTH57924 [Nymphaea thermarum]|nr:hypothetical protein EJ110_NYTH57924 [Nymphaea thermarum]